MCIRDSCRLEHSIIINININIVINIVIVISIIVIITITISASIFPSISQELQGKCKPLSFGAQYHYQYQYQYRYHYRYCYRYRYRCRYHNHYQCSYISKHFPGITRKVQTPVVWSTATEHNKLHTSGWMHILFFAWFLDWMLFLLWESSEDTSVWLCSSQHQSK